MAASASEPGMVMASCLLTGRSGRSAGLMSAPHRTRRSEESSPPPAPSSTRLFFSLRHRHRNRRQPARGARTVPFVNWPFQGCSARHRWCWSQSGTGGAGPRVAEWWASVAELDSGAARTTKGGPAGPWLGESSCRGIAGSSPCCWRSAGRCTPDRTLRGLRSIRALQQGPVVVGAVGGGEHGVLVSTTHEY
jgi:hypothetical protein